MKYMCVHLPLDGIEQQKQTKKVWKSSKLFFYQTFFRCSRCNKKNELKNTTELHGEAHCSASKENRHIINSE